MTHPKFPEGPDEHHAGMVRTWHLAILRFAVTGDNADRLGVFAIANGIDRLGMRYGERPGFRFFRRLSVGLCACIAQRDEAADATLRQYIARIADAPLKRALAAAIEIDPREATPAKGRRKPEGNLWRGLPSRDMVSHDGHVRPPESGR